MKKFITLFILLIGFVNSSNDLYAKKYDEQRKSENNINRLKLKIKMLDGSVFDLQANRSNITIINLWAYWCGMCKSELERLNKLNRKYRLKKVNIIGISIDDVNEIDKVKKITKNLSFKNGIYDNSYVTDFERPASIPQTYILNSNDELINGFMGKTNDGEIEEIILKNIK